MQKGILKGMLVILLILNVILIINYLLSNKNIFKPTNEKYGNLLLSKKAGLNTTDSFYNSYCPEMSITTSYGEIINLRSLAGQVILIKFTGFYPSEVPYLLYLDHVGDYYKKAGLNLFFVSLRPEDDIRSCVKQINLVAPLVIDDGLISSLFNASLGDVIMVGRDFRIKFKYGNTSNNVLYNQLRRALFEGQTPISEDEERPQLAGLITEISYENIQNGKIETVGVEAEDKAIIVNFIISACFECPEKGRLSILKEVAERLDKDHQAVVFVLFGYGNDDEALRKYSSSLALTNANIRVGIVRAPSRKRTREYYSLFRLDLEARLMVIDKNMNLTYIERPRDSIDGDTILSKLWNN